MKKLGLEKNGLSNSREPIMVQLDSISNEKV